MEITKSKFKNDRKCSIIVTIFWLILLIIFINPYIIMPIINHNKDIKKIISEGYRLTTLVFDHIDDNNMAVYKYDVDGEKYTYKEPVVDKSNLKKGKKIESYYDTNEPSNIKTIEKTQIGFKDIDTSTFFIIIAIGLCLLVSIIDIIIAGTWFSLVMAAMIILTYQCMVWVSLVKNNLLSNIGDNIFFIIPTIVLIFIIGLYTALMITIGVVSIRLFKLKIQSFKERKAKSKNKD